MKDQENEAEAKIKASFFHVSDVEVTAIKGLSCLQKSRKSLEQANKQGHYFAEKNGNGAARLRKKVYLCNSYRNHVIPL